MAPSAKVIKQALVDGTCTVFREDPDAISVNKVRRHVTDDLELGEDFFSTGEWKQNSKLVIKETVDKLHDGWNPDTKPVKKAKNGVKKRHSSDEEAEEPQPKRRKSAKPAKKVKKEASDFSDEEEDEPQPKRRKNSKSTEPVKNEVSDESGEGEDEPQPKRRRNSKSTKLVKEEDSANSDEDEERSAPKRSIARRGARKSADVSDDDEEDEPEGAVKESSSPEQKQDAIKSGNKAEVASADITKRDSSEDEDIKAASALDDSADDTKPSKAAEDSKDGVVNEEDEYSDVIDEGPAPKRRGRPKKEPGVKKEKGVKKEPREPKKRTTSDTKPADTDPNEAEIKKLQGHLTKCGVRKLWHHELKKYGDDARAKIKHLRGMLKDIGMDGRFSEQKAREIKEMRELKAEVEAAEEMNALWGTEGRAGRGVKRGKSKGVKMEESDDEDDGGDEVKDEIKDEDDEKDTFAARRRRAQADLAFLGDDSDSD